MRRIVVIGIGTGNPEHMTVQAINALNQLDVVLIPRKGEAKADLADALELHIDGMRAEMTAMPPARHRDEILTSIDHHVVEDYVVEIDVEPLSRHIHSLPSNGPTRLS